MEIKKNKSILSVVLVLCLVFAFILTACGGGGSEGVVDDSLDRILNQGKIAIAVPQDTPLFGIQAADGSYEGFDIDFAMIIGEELGVEVELVPVTSANRIPFLESGRVDLVISNMGVRPDRAQVINFSNPYAPFFWAVYGTQDKDVSGPEDTIPYKVGATLGTLEEIAFTDAAPPATEILRYNDQATTVQAFLSGQVDLIVTGNAIAAEIIRQNPDMGVESKFVIQQSPCHVGVRRGETSLLNWVNALIYTRTLNGDLDALSMKWFGEPLPDFPPF